MVGIDSGNELNNDLQYPCRDCPTDYCDDDCEDLKVWANKAEEAIRKAHKYLWHDLRKNPEDLPSEVGYYFCKVDADYAPYRVMRYEEFDVYAKNANKWYEALYPHTVVYNHFIIAWREVEPFEEEME